MRVRCCLLFFLAPTVKLYTISLFIFSVYLSSPRRKLLYNSSYFVEYYNHFCSLLRRFGVKICLLCFICFIRINITSFLYKVSSFNLKMIHHPKKRNTMFKPIRTSIWSPNVGCTARAAIHTSEHLQRPRKSFECIQCYV